MWSEKQKRLATQYAEMFVNVNEYTMLEPKIRDWRSTEENQVAIYTYTFVRQINGMDSTDKITVEITSKGHLAYINAGDAGVFSGNMLTAIQRYRREDIEAFCAERFPNSKVMGMRCVVTPTGKAAVLVWAHNEEGKQGSTYIVKATDQE